MLQDGDRARIEHWEKNIIQYVMWHVSQLPSQRALRYLVLGLSPRGGELHLSVLYADQAQDLGAEPLEQMDAWPDYAQTTLKWEGPEASQLMHTMRDDCLVHPDFQAAYVQAARDALCSSYVSDSLKALSLEPRFTRLVFDLDSQSPEFCTD